MSMRKIVVMFSALSLLTACSMAQYSGSGSESQANQDLIIVEGCLGESIGTYNLTDPSGASYKLAGKTEKLKDHIGQTIRVMASSTAVENVPGSMSDGTETQPTLSVITFKRLSDLCTNGANNIP
jgi:hypothetical protein